MESVQMQSFLYPPDIFILRLACLVALEADLSFTARGPQPPHCQLSEALSPLFSALETRRDLFLKSHIWL